MTSSSISFPGGCAERSPVADLAAAYRHGQIFLTWREAATPVGTTFNVYRAEHPLARAADLGEARRIGHHLERGSARDWWQDPASFSAQAESRRTDGFCVADATPPLPPESGLFVHTVEAAESQPGYFAVTTTAPDGVEDVTLHPGRNTLTTPVGGPPALPRPIWLGADSPPAPGAAAGKALVLSLHGRGEGVTAGQGAQPVNYLVFGDARMGWREGQAFKFNVRLMPEAVIVTPCDRAWTGGRAVLESKDARDHCPAINTFWYGYHARLYESTLSTPAVVPPYTEEYLLWLVRWAQTYLGTARARTYIRGGSMGGSGAVSMALHHPEVFAAVCAHVPVVSYTRPGYGSAVRLECFCGPLDRPVMTPDGVPLLDYMNGPRAVARCAGDLPYLFLMHGRQDESIPWENNPPFIRALEAARQGFAAYWNDGKHDMLGTAPKDVHEWEGRLWRIRLDASYLAFSRCSDSRDPGQGDPADGDREGWFHRGLDWRDLTDTPEAYAVTITADYPGLVFPLTTDVTPRRVQRFTLRAGEEVLATVGGQPPRALRADAAGRITVPSIRIETPAGVRLRLARAPLRH